MREVIPEIDAIQRPVSWDRLGGVNFLLQLS